MVPERTRSDKFQGTKNSKIDTCCKYHPDKKNTIKPLYAGQTTINQHIAIKVIGTTRNHSYKLPTAGNIDNFCSMHFLCVVRRGFAQRNAKLWRLVHFFALLGTTRNKSFNEVFS